MSLSMRTLSRFCIIPVIAAIASGAGHDWPAYGGGPAGIRYSDLKQINRGNVKQLTVAWQYDTADGAGDPQTQPILVDGVLYGLIHTTKPSLSMAPQAN